MTGPIVEGPPENILLPQKSLGVIFYERLKQWDPNRVLLVDANSEEITCARLLKTAIGLAKKLKSYGVNKGDVITIISQNHWKYFASVLAGFFIGATINLLNHDYTSGELKHLLICKPVLTFCTAKNLRVLLKLKEKGLLSGNIFSYDGETSEGTKNFDDLLDHSQDNEPFSPPELDTKTEVAFVLTSSGTTGFPKCVQLTHSNFRITMTHLNDPSLVDINENERVIGFLPFFHIFGLAIGLASILHGAKFIIMEKFAPHRFLEVIQNHKITKLFVVPPVLLFLVKSPLVQKYDLSSVTDILCGAASVNKELEEIAEKKLNIMSVRQIYGMTESCGAVTMTPKNVKNFGSAGRVITTFCVKVCDTESGRALPANEIGELRCKGDGVMKGYLGNDKETAESFDEEGFLKTGDLGYYDEEGYFYIVDRLKEIIKYRGFQVSPAELENLLFQHPLVRDAGVVGKPDERAGEIPVAFVVKQPNGDITEEELVSYVAGTIMIVFFVPLIFRRRLFQKIYQSKNIFMEEFDLSKKSQRVQVVKY